MSRKLKISCNETLKEIGIFNRIQAIYIPVDVSVSVSFVGTPKDDELFPLTRLVSDKQADGDMVENARRCFLHITGTSTEDMILICSNVTAESGYVDVEELEALTLEASTKSVIENIDKLINPYELINQDAISTNSTSLVTILDKTMTCDKLDLTVFMTGFASLRMSRITLYVDDVIHMDLSSYSSTYGMGTSPIEHITLEDIKNKNVKINAQACYASYFAGAILKEYTLKT